MFMQGGYTPFFMIAMIWFVITLVLKGYALWHAAKRNEIWWFLALFILNTFGILELIYIIFFLKNWPGKTQAQHHNQAHHASHDHTDHTNHAA